MKIKAKKALIAVGLIILVAVAGVATGWLLTGFTTTPTAEVVYVEGFVEHNSDGKWIETTANTTLPQNAQIRVSGEGFASLKLKGGSYVRLAADSKITFSDLDPDQLAITNDSGNVYARVAKSQSSTFSIVVGSYTFQSQGTAFKTINTSQIKAVEVYESKVKAKDGGKNISVEQGNKYYAENKEETSKEKKTEEININDLKIDEFAIWNFQQDKGISDYKNKLGILKDLAPPTLTLLSPLSDVSTDVTSVNIEGKTDKGVKIYINQKSVEVDKDGYFTYEYTIKSDDTYIKIVAQGEDGNYAFKKIYIKESKATPLSPTITKTKALTKTATPAKTPTITKTAQATDTPAPTNTQNQAASITLSANTYSFNGFHIGTAQPSYTVGINFSWTVANLDLGDVSWFKLVKSASNSHPTYGDDTLVAATENSARAYQYPIGDGSTYYYAVCAVKADHSVKLCSSNVVQVTAPIEPPTATPTSSATITPTSPPPTVTPTVTTTSS